MGVAVLTLRVGNAGGATVGSLADCACAQIPAAIAAKMNATDRLLSISPRLSVSSLPTLTCQR